MSISTDWVVYVLRCGDDSLYTGCTNDLEKRVLAHSAGKGAKYTRARLPVELVYQESGLDRSGALKREFEIKGLSRAGKMELIASLSSRT